jgi:pimeloyl-ACP methyl ester carboxylesterase
MTLRRQLLLVGCAFAVAFVGLLGLGERTGPTGGWLREAGLQPRDEIVDGLRIRYVRRGEGSPLVLLHGIGSSLYSWHAVLPDLARDHDVLALDFPGFGGSERPPQLSFERLVAVVLGLLDRLALGRVSLAGNSLGGAVAVAVAAHDPDRIERLVLIDSAGFHLAPAEWPPLLRVVEATPAPLLEWLPVKRKLAARTLPRLFFDPRHVTEEVIDEYAEPLQQRGTMRAFRSLLRSAVANPTPFDGLARVVQARTLVLWGREDPWIPVADVDRFGATIAGSVAVILSGCGHLPQEERPAETVALIRSFLSRW